ncbi:MAG: hypothetical protein IJD24_00660 [Agathobacter sp.]|nr:hypothetical protein [Agathobacter sp.]MBQ6812637.1 hypothetical protein [Agathobacter sp.]
MDLISIIILCVVIARVFKKNSPEKYEETIRKAKSLGSEVVEELRGNMESKRATYEQQRRNFEQQTQPRRAKQTTRTAPAYEQINMQDYQKSQSANAARTARTVQPTSTIMEENDEARQQIYKSRMEAKNTTILQRARANADEDKEDVTLRSLEESHGHSAHVTPAVHNHPEDVIPENSLEKIEDLMVKGYEADLCFERDFVGEAMDMVNRFSMGGSV